MDKRRIKLIVIDIVERMNYWEEITIAIDESGITLFSGYPEDVPLSILNTEVTGLGISEETLLVYIHQ